MTITFGLSMSSIFATAFSLPLLLNVNISGVASSILIGSRKLKCSLIILVGASIGDMVLPMITGWLISSFGPQTLLISILSFFIPAVTISIILVFFFSGQNRKWRIKCCDKKQKKKVDKPWLGEYAEYDDDSEEMNEV